MRTKRNKYKYLIGYDDDMGVLYGRIYEKRNAQWIDALNWKQANKMVKHLSQYSFAQIYKIVPVANRNEKTTNPTPSKGERG